MKSTFTSSPRIDSGYAGCFWAFVLLGMLMGFLLFGCADRHKPEILVTRQTDARGFVGVPSSIITINRTTYTATPYKLPALNLPKRRKQHWKTGNTFEGNARTWDSIISALSPLGDTTSPTMHRFLSLEVYPGKYYYRDATGTWREVCECDTHHKESDWLDSAMKDLQQGDPRLLIDTEPFKSLDTALLLRAKLTDSIYWP